MTPSMLKALFLDALFQVLDNKVFRILAILALIPVLMTLVIGFREDEIVLLFGVKRWSYDGLVGFFEALSGVRGAMSDPQTFVIGAVSEQWIAGIPGTVGIMITIAATAFFVPRMIEKGAADVLFHKPISRFLFFVSRYFAGLLFIGIVGSVMVGGMYLGFLLVSGYNDPGILWAVLTLTYTYALIHAITMLIGVMTRSTVASILLSIIFFMINGCVHGGWITKEQLMETHRLERELEGEEPEEFGAVATTMLFALDALHFTLPKTTDADYITAKLRKAIERDEPPYLDPVSQFEIAELPEGFRERDPSLAPAPGADAADLFGTALYSLEVPETGLTVTLWGRERRRLTRVLASREREVTETYRDAGDELEEILEARGLEFEDDRDTIGGEEIPQPGSGVMRIPVPAMIFTWEEDGVARSTALFTREERFHVLDVRGSPETLEEDAERVEELFEESGIRSDVGQGTWYRNRFDWDAEWRYNIFFSLGSSLAFTVFMLFLGWIRIRRIDF